jgi:hypothetical protein
MTKVVKFQGGPVPIYLEVVCPECGPARPYQADQRRRPAVRGAVVVNNEIGQTERCPNCDTKLVVTTEAVVVKLLEETSEERF